MEGGSEAAPEWALAAPCCSLITRFAQEIAPSRPDRLMSVCPLRLQRGVVSIKPRCVIPVRAIPVSLHRGTAAMELRRALAETPLISEASPSRQRRGTLECPLRRCGTPLHHPRPLTEVAGEQADELAAVVPKGTSPSASEVFEKLELETFAGWAMPGGSHHEPPRCSVRLTDLLLTTVTSLIQHSSPSGDCTEP